MPLTFLYPEALLIGALLIILYWRFVKNKNIWRTAMVIIVALLLAYPSFQLRSNNIDLFVLLDRSRSIPAEGIAKQSELLALASDALQPGDRISVVTFNSKGFVEQAPSPHPAVREYVIPFSPDASDLANGLATALSMVSDTRQSRILLLSDGEFTGQNPTQQAQIARQMNVPIYVRDLKRLNIQNLFVSDVETDEKLLANEPCRVVFRVNSTIDMPGRYRVYRDGQIIGESENNGWHPYNFRAGENRIAFSDSVAVSGIHGYRIEVETTPAGREKVVADNVAEKFVSVVGERPILVVNNDGQPDNITAVLRAGGIPLHLVAIGDYNMDINQLAGYKGVVLNNVPLTGMTKSAIDDLARFVTQEGGGLLVAGGNRSFGAGGYYRSGLEDILPVSLEDRRQNKKISAAFSFVLDRSGSMAVPVPSGDTKMDLANAAAVEALNLLSASDSISVIAVDSAAHIFVPQQPADNTAAIASQIRSIESMGGGIFVYTGLVAAGSQIAGAPQANKHVLLFSDAADSEEPGDYIALLEKFVDAGITVSVVGMGTEHDIDAGFLKDIARRGGGNIYFTEDVAQLIQFFTADTIQYTRKNFIEDPAPMKILPGAFTMSPGQSWQDFSSADYNLLFPREGAEVAIATANGDNSPVLAFWQRGVGRAAALAVDTAGPFSDTPDFPDIVLSAARWVMGSNVSDNFQIESETDGNYARITMEVSDEERAAMGQAKLVMFAPDGSTIERPLQWDNWNRLSADIRLNQTGAWRGLIQVGDESYRVGPVSMPVSPEFAYTGAPDSGRQALLQLAAITGGKELLNIKPLFERENATVINEPLVIPLLILLLLALLGEIAESRFAWAHRLKTRIQSTRYAAAIKQQAASISDKITQTTHRRARYRRRPRPRETREGNVSPTDVTSIKTPTPEPTPTTPDNKTAQPAATATEESAKPKEKPTLPEDMNYLTKVKARARKTMKKKEK